MAGYMSVKGNKRSDEGVKVEVKTRGIRIFPKLFTSLVHIGRTVTERKWKEAKHSFWNRHESHSHIQAALHNSALEMLEPNKPAIRRQAHISHQ